MRSFDSLHRPQPFARAAAALLIVSVAACSGRDGSSAIPGAPHSQLDARLAPVTFTMHWNSATASAVRRSPKYISPSALSVSITVNQGVPQVLNFPATTLAINAPVGTDLFTFATYDEAYGQGNVLGRAAITQSIVDGAANTVTAVLGGIIASLAITLGNPTPNAGTAAAIPITASGRDADGNTIVGSSDYGAPIVLTITDPANSGTLSLSTKSLQSPAAAATLNYNGGTLVSASVVASTTGVASVSATISPTPTVYQYAIPTAASKPNWIALGPDGNMWFTEQNASKIGRITPAGTVTEFATPTGSSEPSGIISASDGRLWFGEYAASQIGALTTGGTFSEYPTAFASDSPGLLVDRGDGTIWYTGYTGNHVSVQPIDGSAGYGVSVPTVNSAPYGITTAVDNNIYFTEQLGENIGHLPNIGTAPVEVPVPALSYPQQIVRGPDGNLWFTDYGTSTIGRFSPLGLAYTAYFPTPTPNSVPFGITVGADGALWFTENATDKIGRTTTDGTTMIEYPAGGLAPRGIAAGPTGALWFTEYSSNRIGELVY